MKLKHPHGVWSEILADQRILVSLASGTAIERPPELCTVRISQQAIKRSLVHRCRIFLRFYIFHPVNERVETRRQTKAKRFRTMYSADSIKRRVRAVCVNAILVTCQEFGCQRA